ncbi:hypothetical protein BT96DRAFT_950784 [Gymnopus androsaceus JB14]|uniref:Uncharacterized protein n=1 Tax=Gymnopus androsaceus JB14 TaxID=1447944 RepID=A0A6A4GFE0_9AGAR|nr:hypothetical protein BT96DRAFT_950784 [Gymnopus androsaceus JB14]
MTDSSFNQRSLHVRGPNGRVLPTSASSDTNFIEHQGEQDEQSQNAAALNRLLSPLPSGTTASDPSESTDEGALGNTQCSPRTRERSTRSFTRFTESEEDPLGRDYHVERTTFEFEEPDPFPNSARVSLGQPPRDGTPNHTGVGGVSPPGPDHGRADPSRTGTSVRFEIPDHSDSVGHRVPDHPEPAFVLDAITNGTTGRTTILSQCNGSAREPHQSSRQQEKSRALETPAPSGSSRTRSTSPRRGEPLPSSYGTAAAQHHLRLPAFNANGLAPNQGFALPPVAPLMDHAFQYGFAPQFPAPHISNQGYHTAPVQPLHHGRVALAPIQTPGWPAHLPLNPGAQGSSTGPWHHQDTAPAPAESEDTSQVAHPVKKKTSLADPRKAVVGSLTNPFRSRTGGCNPKYAHELRHNKWARWTPLGGFAP